jgi:hypothetical protein
MANGSSGSEVSEMSRFRHLVGVLSCCAFLGALVPSLPLHAADQADLLGVVRAGHRSARESIRTLSATVTIEVTFPKPAPFATAKYWRSLDVVRIQKGDPETACNEYLLKDSEIRQVGRSREKPGGPYQYTAARRSPSAFFCECDAWTEMLIDFGGPAGGQYEHDRWLEFAKRAPRVRREKLDGRDCIRVTISYDTTAGIEITVTHWHDVGYNYLVRKVAMESGSSGEYCEAEILEFLEGSPGIFFPTKCRKKVSRGGQQVNGSLTTLSDVRINEPIAADVFRLPAIPAGTRLVDRVEDKVYPVDENWRAIGEAKPYRQGYVAVSKDEIRAGYQAQSTEEPRSFTRWLIPGSLVILALAGACWFYRRYRTR